MSHLSALGFPISPLRLVDQLFVAPTTNHAWPAADGSSRWWKGAAGNGLWLHLREGNGFDCLVPVFTPSHRVHVNVRGFFDDSCRHCGGVVVENANVEKPTPFPFGVQLADLHVMRSRIAVGQPCDLFVAAVADRVLLFDSVQAHDAHWEEVLRHNPQATPYSSQMFIPIGLMDEATPNSVSLFTGIIREVKREPAAAMAEATEWLRIVVDTLEMTLECALDLEHEPRVKVGGVIGGEFWLVAEASRTWPIRR